MKVSFRLYDCSARAERKKKTVVFVVVILDVVDVLWIIVQEMLSHSGITFSSISLLLGTFSVIVMDAAAVL